MLLPALGFDSIINCDTSLWRERNLVMKVTFEPQQTNIARLHIAVCARTLTSPVTDRNSDTMLLLTIVSDQFRGSS